MIKRLDVLAIDDDPSVLAILAAFLETKGHRVETRASGREGLDALRDDNTFDLIICDIRMAGMNGFEFLKIARANHPHVGIILMTAYDEEYPYSEALRAGADGYLTKPFNFEKLSLIFEHAYWEALSRQDWWERHDDGASSAAAP